MENFKQAGLPEPLFHRLEQMGFNTPTPIQAQAIPPALEGRDILGSAQTGTGKTAAYGIPLITKLLTDENAAGLILLPTRELATQVMQALKTFIGTSKIKTALLIGGEPMPRQFNQLKARPRLIVATPGRLNDHLERGSAKLHFTTMLVLDEVDRMLDMGFGKQLDVIAQHLNNVNQTLMFSATMPDNIQKLSSKYLKDPVRITIGATYDVADNVKQEQIKLTDGEKYERLVDELHAREGSVIVFVRTKHGADRMAGKLKKLGHKTDAIHGDLRQSRRNSVIRNFREQNYRILIATDVAARGLDIPHIQHVINYDMPQNPEDYIHRIGRTARAGAEGNAVNFIGSTDRAKWNAIERLLGGDTSAQGDTGGKPKRPRKPGKGHKHKAARRGAEAGGRGRSTNDDQKFVKAKGKGKPHRKGKNARNFAKKAA